MMKTYRDKMKKRNKKQLFMWNDENNQVNDENIQKKNKKKKLETAPQLPEAQQIFVAKKIYLCNL